VSAVESIDSCFREADFFPHVPYEDVGQLIVEEAERIGLRLPLACALVQQESGGKNIMGCDAGAPFCHKPVTARRVRMVLAYVDGGGASQGVGLTQITYPPLIRAAEALGGAHLPRYQLRIGFRVLRDYLDTYPVWHAIGAYNGGPFNPVRSYADSVLAKRTQWRERFGL
jgi:hypothetical protein